MRKFKKNDLRSWVAICSYGASLLAYPGFAAAEAVIEEVIVRAQGTKENILETPVAVQAISGEEFQKGANFNFQDISKSVPGLSFNPGVTPDIRLRGVASVTLAGVSLRTNIYQDGALIEQPRGMFDAQYDIESFEVLKGPQGTLYGKSSPTGTINVRTANPNLSEVDGYVAVSRAQYNSTNNQIAVSLPIIENVLGVRLSGVYDENQAQQTKSLTTGEIGTSRASSGRIVVLWQPSDEFRTRFSYQYRENKTNPLYNYVGNGYSASDDVSKVNNMDLNATRNQLGVLQFDYKITDHLALTSVTAYEDQDYRNIQDTDGVGVTGTEFNTPPQYLMNPSNGVGGYGLVPSLGTNPDVPTPAGLAAYQAFYAPYNATGDVQTTHIPLRPQIQEDLRLVSSDNPFWDWQLGAYYHKEVTATKVSVIRAAELAQVAAAGYIDTAAVLTSEEWAGYLHNTFKLTDQLSLIAGLRYQEQRLVASQPTSGHVLSYFADQLLHQSPDLLQLGAISANGIPDDLKKQTYHPVTGTLKVKYAFNPDLDGYVTLDRAYRTGAANLNIQANLPSDFAQIKPESANSIELGLKGKFADQRGDFTLAIFDQIYKNFQQDDNNATVINPPLYSDATLPPGTNPGQRDGVNKVNPNDPSTWQALNYSTPPSPQQLSALVLNAKEAETRGAEFGVNYLLLDNWTTGFNIAYTDSKFKDFKNFASTPSDINYLTPWASTTPGIPPVGGTCCVGNPAFYQLNPTGQKYYVIDLSGKRMPFASRWAGNIKSNFFLPAFDGTEWYFNTLVNFQSDQIDKTTRSTLGGYATVDLFTGLRAAGAPTWDVSLWLKNAFDRRAITSIYNPGLTDPSNGGKFDLVTTNLPRQLGASASYHF